eukprot:4993145-Prymnesium_polylepis.1
MSCVPCVLCAPPQYGRFDFTLEEAGVEAASDSNVQLLANQRAKLAVGGLQRIAGYPGAGTKPRNLRWGFELTTCCIARVR